MSSEKKILRINLSGQVLEIESLCEFLKLKEENFELDISNTHLSEKDFVRIASIKKIRTLIAQNNNFGCIDLTGLEHIVHLDLSLNQRLRKIIPSSCHKNSSLERLNLQQTKIRESEDLEELLKVNRSNLKFVELTVISGNPYFFNRLEAELLQRIYQNIVVCGNVIKENPFSNSPVSAPRSLSTPNSPRKLSNSSDEVNIISPYRSPRRESSAKKLMINDRESLFSHRKRAASFSGKLESSKKNTAEQNLEAGYLSAIEESSESSENAQLSK